MERILEAEADVLKMSIGSTFQWPQFPTAQAADRLVDAGIVAVASIGNEARTASTRPARLAWDET